MIRSVIQSYKYKILQDGYEVRIYDITTDKLCYTEHHSRKLPATKLNHILHKYILEQFEKGGAE